MTGNGPHGSRSAVSPRGSLPVGSAGLALVALVLGPVAIAGAGVGVCLAAGQLRWHWWHVLGSAAGLTAAVVVIELSSGVSPLGLHYGGLLSWFGAPSWSFSGIVRALLPSLPLGLPGGIAIGAAMTGAVEVLARGVEWHPLEQRRQLVSQVHQEREVAALLGDQASQDRCSSVPLGVASGGDLRTWQEGHFVVVPRASASLGLGIVGSSGSGKTVTIERLVMSCAARGRRVVLVDAKGSDPSFPERMAAAYLACAPDRGAAVQAWPATPLDAWRGDPASVANRLLSVQDYTEPYWKALASTAVRLALCAPGAPCRSSADFLARLSPSGLKRAYSGHREAETVAALLRRPDGLDGVRLRYGGFFAALDGRFDGQRSYGDAALTILTVPTLAAREDGEAAVRMLLADFAHWATVRKARRGDDVTLIVDEFSAVSAAASVVIDLAERVRDVGGQVVVSAQSYEGLGGDEDERKRMVGALGAGVILHRCADPDELLKPAGTVRKIEHSWQLQDSASSGMGSMRMAYGMRVEPDDVRQARIGEAWVISSGRALRTRVIATHHSPAALAAVRHQLTAQAAYEARSPWAAPEPEVPEPPQPPPSFLDDLDDGS